jgi:hypothetical protein
VGLEAADDIGSANEPPRAIARDSILLARLARVFPGTSTRSVLRCQGLTSQRMGFLWRRKSRKKRCMCAPFYTLTISVSVPVCVTSASHPSPHLFIPPTSHFLARSFKYLLQSRVHSLSQITTCLLSYPPTHSFTHSLTHPLLHAPVHSTHATQSLTLPHAICTSCHARRSTSCG